MSAQSTDASPQANDGSTRRSEPIAAQSNGVFEVTPSLARMMVLGDGLYELTVGPIPALEDQDSRLALPATLVAASPTGGGYDLVEIAVSSGATLGWLPANGGTVIAKAPPNGGVIVVTTFGIGEEADLPRLEVRRLDRQLPPKNETAAPKSATRVDKKIPVELTLHIESQGDRRFKGNGWVGSIGSRLRIEAFAVHPLAAIKPNEIEYMAFGPLERKTPWTTGSTLCGTRGLRMPLTGFAVRLAANLQERFDVIYEGAFFQSGRSRACRNGEPCRPSIANDPLEAMRLRIIERVSG